MIKVSTLIGYGSPNKADSHDVHGAPLGAEETAATRANLKWEYPEFEVPKVSQASRRRTVNSNTLCDGLFNQNCFVVYHPEIATPQPLVALWWCRQRQIYTVQAACLHSKCVYQNLKRVLL